MGRFRLFACLRSTFAWFVSWRSVPLNRRSLRFSLLLVFMQLYFQISARCVAWDEVTFVIVVQFLVLLVPPVVVGVVLMTLCFRAAWINFMRFLYPDRWP